MKTPQVLSVLMFLFRLVKTTESQQCKWREENGKRLKPLITFGTPMLETVANASSCRNLCLSQTAFLCAAYNYKPAKGGVKCEILAENDSTGNFTEDGEWNSRIRPACAGLWLPWQAVRNKTIDSEGSLVDAPNLRTCMSMCLATNNPASECRSVSMHKTDKKCRINNGKSGDEGVTTKGSASEQYFDRPTWYLETHSGGTITTLITGNSKQRKEVHLSLSRKISRNGYLVAWQYYAGAITENACESYAAVWREETTHYRRIIETRIVPEYSSSGIKFQYVQNSTVEVKVGDLLGIHVVDDGGCSGNIITTQGNSAEKALSYDGSDSSNRPQEILTTSSILKIKTREVCIRAYIAEYFTLESPSSNHNAPLAEGQIRVTWNLPPKQYQEGSGLATIEYSPSSDFTNSATASYPLENEEAIIYTADIRNPYYARLVIVRPYYDDLLVQTPDDSYYLVNKGDPFCAERGQLKESQIDIVESGDLIPEMERTLTVTVPGFSNDECVVSVKVTHGTGTLAKQDKRSSRSFTKQQGVTFRLTVSLLLLDDHESVVWDSDYTTWEAPAAPSALTANEVTSNSVLLSWSPPQYSSFLYPLTSYQISCSSTDTSTIQRNTSQHDNSYRVNQLLSHQNYECRVRALVEGGGYGELSQPVSFTTLEPGNGMTTETPTSTASPTTELSSITGVQQSSPNPTQPLSSSPSNSVGGIIGGVVGVVVIIVLIAVIVVRKRRYASSDRPEEGEVLQKLESYSGNSKDNKNPIMPVADNKKPTMPVADNKKPIMPVADNKLVMPVADYQKPIMPVAPNPNPSPDDATSFTDILVSELQRVINEKKRANPEEPFAAEYSNIGMPAVECLVGRQEGNIAKNRFRNITATDSNRVTLRTTRGYSSDYINANYIMDYRGTSSFIAAQGPLPSTIEDMWRMVHDTNSSTIVMLTNPVEATKKKCAIYWPTERNPERFGRFEVRLAEEQILAEYVVRKLVYTFEGTSRAVRQFHFTRWPDHGVPTTTGLLSFRQRVKQDAARNRAPMIVHCSAGVGRTGTFIGLDILIDEAHDKSKGVPAVNPMKCVYEMRKQRTKMIQTHDQLQFLYEVLAEALACGDSVVECSLFTETVAKWRKAAPNRKSLIEKQFDGMNVAPEVAPSRYSVAKTYENVPKNRAPAILPLDSHRVRISADIDGTDYINGVFVHGYHHRNGFIVTQTPLSNTTQDFWNMIIAVQSPVIVFFNDTKVKPYWPANGTTIQSGLVTVECLRSSNPCDWYKEVEFFCTMGSTEHKTKLIVVKMPSKLPTPSQMVTLCNNLQKYATTENDVITVQCSDGSRLSGLFVVAMNLFLRARIEQEVDVVLEVKLARRSRPEFITDFASFNFLYDFISSYLSEFSDYSNFR